MQMVNLTIDGKAIQIEAGKTILQAAREANIQIPTLCFLKDVNEIGACRMCVVEIKGARALQAACVYPVAEGIEVYTNSPAVRSARKVTLELILSNHEKKCLSCKRNQNCELQAMANDLGIEEIRFVGKENNSALAIDDFSTSIVRDPNKCILCRRCVGACKNIQGIGAIDAQNRGFTSTVAPAFGKKLCDTACVNCGQCVVVCPVGALTVKDDTQKVWKAIEDPNKYVICQTAPAVRAAIGEPFGMEIGTPCTGKMVSGLKMLGFDKVFDTDTGADFTIMEEGTELIQRIKNGGKLPMITSCSPGWIKYCEHNYPEFLENLSTCKSPHEMFGAILKTYYAEKNNIDPRKIVVVSIMPCTAKKFEAAREELGNDGLKDVDFVLTTAEAAKMMKQAGIKMNELDDSEFDNPMGEASGAAVIFGATGGVMEAALRTVYTILEGKPLDDLNITAVRGIEGIKETEIEMGGMKVKAAVASSLSCAKELLEQVKSGEKEYHFIEIMGCPGGCVNGGGQPIQPASVRNWLDLRTERAKALYSEDARLPVRESHKNQVVKKIYDEFLGEPGGHKPHKYLHTHYVARPKFPEADAE